MWIVTYCGDLSVHGHKFHRALKPTDGNILSRKAFLPSETFPVAMIEPSRGIVPTELYENITCIHSGCRTL